MLLLPILLLPILLLSAFSTSLPHPFSAPEARACTAYYDDASGLMMKSYDWKDGAGFLAYHPAGRTRVALQTRDPGRPYQWQARYASVSFDQYGVGFSNGGINEKGLAVEVLWLDETRLPAPDERPYLNELEWVRYQLETAATLDELVTNARSVRVSSIHGKVHYFACDEEGRCAAVEYIDGSLQVHRGEELTQPALTNHSYRDSLSFLSRFRGFGGSRPLLADQSRGSLPRFLQAARAAQRGSMLPPDAALRALRRVEIPGYTKWQISYQLRARAISFRQAGVLGTRSLSLDELQRRAPSCEEQLVYPLSGRVVGDLADAFRPLDDAENQRSLRARFAKLELPRALADRIAAHRPSCSTGQ